MKIALLFGLILTGVAAYAQPKDVPMATVNITTTIVAPEGEDVSNIQNQGDGRMNFRNFGDGETKSVVYIKNDLVKTVAKSDMGRTTTIRDNKTKMTTTLLEIMGNKTGFYATDEEQEQARKSMDSMMRARTKDSSNAKPAPKQTEASPVDLVLTEETKKIAGYDCKKAYLITTKLMILKDTAIVWYTPSFKVPNFTPTGASGAIVSFTNPANTSNGLDKVDGFIMRYETKMRRNRTMIMEVTKIDLAKEIADKEFNIPKDFDVKPMKEMRNQMGNGQGQQFQIRRGD